MIDMPIASWMMSIPCFDHGTQWALPGVKSGKGRASEYRGKIQRYECGSKFGGHRTRMIYGDLWMGISNYFWVCDSDGLLFTSQSADYSVLVWR